MNVLLVYPRYPDTFWSYRHALRFIGKKAVFPPLGLLTVAALLPEAWGKRLVDVNVEDLTDDAITSADYVFLSAMGVQRESATDILNRCRRLGVKTVAGGPLFTSCHDEFPLVDHLVLDEAEATLPLFLNDLDMQTPRQLYRAQERPELSHTPLPLWGLIDMRNYASMNIQYSRGCPFDCEFCDITQLFGRKPRTKSSHQVLAELDALYVRGWRGGVFFVDDNFIADKGKLTAEILPAMISWMRARKNPFFFFTEASIDLADNPDLLALMVEAGFREVFIGIESPEETSLHEAGKIQNRGRNMLESVRKIHQAGLQVQAGFIVGFDSDTPAVFEKQFRFVQESGIVTAMIGILMALRGTKLHRRLAEEGRIIGGASGNNTDVFLNFVPKMPADTLVSGYRNLLRTIYVPSNYYKRVITFLKDYRPSGGRSFFRLQYRDIRAFAASIIVLGIIGSERFHYWKIVLWSLLRKPRLLPVAITLAIYGFHYRKMAQKVGSCS